MAGQRNPKIHLSFIEILPVVINQLFRTISTVNSHSVEPSRSLLPSTKKSSREAISCVRYSLRKSIQETDKSKTILQAIYRRDRRCFRSFFDEPPKQLDPL